MAWRLVSHDPLTGRLVEEYEIDEKTTIVRTRYWAPVAEAFAERNRQALNDSYGVPFGDGKVVASIPMHVWAREIAPARRNGDDRYIRKWLNDPDNRVFRIFRGRV